MSHARAWVGYETWGWNVLASHLSFADRENLLQTIRELSSEELDVDFLLKKTGEWAHALQPQFGFEQALLRNLTQLANYLRLHEAAEDIASIARGAIQFIVSSHGKPADDLTEGEDDASDTAELHALGQAFIASYAVHEIAVRLGEPVAYHPPAITEDERNLAEEIFEKLSLLEGCDVKLVDRVQENLDELQGLAECGFLKRLSNNAKTLIAVLQDPGSSEDDKTCARGALRYFVEDDDAINDELGLIGYLDDLFILQTAIDLVSPVREPLIELLDHVVGVWPFLNMLTLDDGSGPRAASEFAILNSALSCRNLRSDDAINTMLIAPETGPIAILLGFVSTLGLAHDAGLRQLTEKSFTPGQKVLVDYEAVAEFDGFEDVNGRRMFWLLKYNTSKGVITRSRTSWPISDLYRLVPVDRDRVVRGEIKHGKRNEITDVSGLSFLFNGPNKADVHAITKKVIVVMPTSVAADFCKSTLLYGQPIKDVIPVGQVSADGEETEQWSTRFGTQEPVLLFASDLDVACSFAQDNQDDIELVIVDVAGRNREKHASIKRLNSRKIPCLLVATERTANETEVDQHNDLSVWEWGAEDLRALVWSDKRLPANDSEIAKFESRVQSTSSAKPIVENIAFPIVNEAYKAFCSLRRLAKRRGPDGLPEVEEIVSQAFFAITQLMRCSTELTAESRSIVDVASRISAMAKLMETSNYLSEKERSATTLVVDRIGEFRDQMLQSNPKQIALQRMLDKHPAIDLLCPDARLVSELEGTFKQRRNRVFASPPPGESFANGLLVTGWFKKSRMASVLSPPIADPLILLLYDVERRWHQQFSEHRLTMREERKRLRGRKAIFPAIDGWKKPKDKVEMVEPEEAEIDNIEDVSNDIDGGFRKRIYDRVGAGHSDADTKARLLLFAGGIYGLFTDNYKLNVVTHLFDAAFDSDDDKATVRLCSAKDVTVGDKIVFRPKSRDLIREVADELIEDGQREASGLWRVALRNYMSEHSVSDEAMGAKLRAAGCKSQAQAIGNWIHDDDMIAPRGSSDIQIIAEVTGDDQLSSRIDDVVAAIKIVRSAHQQKAPRVIAKRIRARAAEVVRQEQADEPIVHLDGDLVLVRVAETASKPIPVKYTAANRLIEDDSWHE
ncbi:MAG: DrmE family protein [Planctomycetota bacterium]